MARTPIGKTPSTVPQCVDCAPTQGSRRTFKKQHFGFNMQKPDHTSTVPYNYKTSLENKSTCEVFADRGVSWTCGRTRTYSLIIWGCRKSFRFWISRLIFPTTSRLRIFCLFRIFTATLCPVNWCSPTNGKKALQSHYAEKQDTYGRFKILRWMI